MQVASNMKQTKAEFKGLRSPKKLILAIVGNVLVFLFTITCFYPIVWLILSSFKTQAEFDASAIALPTSLNPRNFIFVLGHSEMPVYMMNSIRNSIIAVIFILLFAFINGYFISRFRFRFRKTLYGFYMLAMLVPFHALLVPLYIVMLRTGLTNAWFTVPLPLIAFNLPISLFLCESFIGSIPKELDEAAAIDGAGFSRVLFTIILPMTKPILVTCAILAFFSAWNEFVFSLILLRDRALYTIPLGLTLLQGTFTTDHPRMMAAMVVAMFPALILYFVFSKQIISGVMAGAIKG